MKLALECPTYLLRDIQPLTDFDWILTHLVLQDEEYAKWYRESMSSKVLDNSVNELLEPCSLSDMEKALNILGGVNRIVPPDFLGDAEKTNKSLKEACKLWDPKRVLPCVQGTTVVGAVDISATNCLKLGFVKVAVPYDITCIRTDSREKMAEKRTEVVRQITGMGLRVHLLGMTTLGELINYKGNTLIESIDTGVPIVYGMNLKHLDEPWDFKKDKPTMSQIDESPPGFLSDKLSAIFWNIAYLRKVLND